MAHQTRQNMEDLEEQELPRRFGNYLLIESLAKGGMGEVYLAKYMFEDLEGLCVVKKLLPDLVRDREYVTRFVDEARVVVMLEDDNICEVFDVGRIGKEYFLAMEYISGVDVKAIAEACIYRQESLAVPAALQIVIDALGGCFYAHNRRHPITKEKLNLVHRDISPHNIVVDYYGETKLIDFGLASSNLKIEKTEPNVVMGKMAYMGPEQARGDDVEPRSDLFSVAVILYELLVGERYYEGMSSNDIWNVVGKGSYTPPQLERIEPKLQEILRQGLHPKPRKRPKDCRAFQKMLQTYLKKYYGVSGKESLRQEVRSLFAFERKDEKIRLTKADKILMSDFEMQGVILMGRDQKDPVLIENDYSILSTREKQLVVEATEIVAQRPPRFVRMNEKTRQMIGSRKAIQAPEEKEKRIKMIAASAVAFILVAFLAIFTLNKCNSDEGEIKDPKSTQVKKSGSHSKSKSSSKSGKSNHGRKVIKRSGIKTVSLSSRLTNIRKSKCKDRCKRQVLREWTLYKKMSSKGKRAFRRNVSSCEKKCH